MLNRLLLGSALLLSLTACDSQALKDVFNKQPAAEQMQPQAQQPQEFASPQSAYQLAYQAAQAKDPARELNILLDANAKYPNDPYLLRPLGYAYIDNKRLSEAAAVFDALIRQNPNNAQSYADKAVALDFMRQHAEAQALYKQALALSPGNASFQNNLAMSLLLGGQVDEAISILEPLSRQPGATKKTRQNLALALGIKGDTQKALALDSQDLTPEQARQNEQFYQQYSARKNAANAPAPVQAPADAPAGPSPKIINAYENNPMAPSSAGPGPIAIVPVPKP